MGFFLLFALGLEQLLLLPLVPVLGSLAYFRSPLQTKSFVMLHGAMAENTDVIPSNGKCESEFTGLWGENHCRNDWSEGRLREARKWKFLRLAGLKPDRWWAR